MKFILLCFLSVVLGSLCGGGLVFYYPSFAHKVDSRYTDTVNLGSHLNRAHYTGMPHGIQPSVNQTYLRRKQIKLKPTLFNDNEKSIE